MKTILIWTAAAICLLISVNSSAVIIPGCTLQTWNFTTTQTDKFINDTKIYEIVPDDYFNPFGAPNASFTIQSLSRDSGWFIQHDNQQGVLYGDRINASIDIPNQSDLNNSKEVCITIHCLGEIQDTEIALTAGNDASTSKISRTIEYETAGIRPEASWATLKEYWIITPQPDFEHVDIKFIRGGTDVDSISIETRPMPEINSQTLFALGGLALYAQRK